MLCQNCGKNEATTHIKRIVDGESAELHLCSSCAQHLGYSVLFSGFGSNIGGLLSRFFPEAVLPSAAEESERCPGCGASFDEIVRTGMMGCAECYDVFYDRLKPSLSRIHGRATHIGKTGTSVDDRTERRAEIRALEADLKTAVAAEEFEQAAVLRDRLRDLKGETT
ncbi:MAG: UvrB/UvrC motif-containing protein [Clostridia bacterium]|nr:UvrB/UvrC motif-containing protein [Clostridia bacterium]MBR5754101.1 UvrB/UvrC motif-containing protein [Clostridia bacterium]